jgi:hypothetical protein
VEGSELCQLRKLQKVMVLEQKMDSAGNLRGRVTVGASDGWTTIKACGGMVGLVDSDFGIELAQGGQGIMALFAVDSQIGAEWAAWADALKRTVQALENARGRRLDLQNAVTAIVHQREVRSTEVHQ